MDNYFYTEEELGKARNLMAPFVMNSPEAIESFEAESDEGGFWDIDVKQIFHFSHRLTTVKTFTVLGHNDDDYEGNIDLIADALGFEKGAIKLSINRTNAKFVYRNEESVIKHLIRQWKKKGTRNVE